MRDAWEHMMVSLLVPMRNPANLDLGGSTEAEEEW